MKTIGHKLIGLVCLATLSACSEWDSHYEAEASGDAATLYETLSSNSETSTFAQIARLTGYDATLSESQTYTVFAPTNDALAGFDMSDITAAERLMRNQIARYAQPTSTSIDEKVRMLNGKNYSFDSTSSFAGVAITDANKHVSNGIIHNIDQQLPFAQNVYEYLADNADYSKLYEFIHRFDETRFDVDQSLELDIDDQGRPVYDSVYVSYNRLLQHKTYGLGHIADEDSLYTMLLPDNTAWDAAYERISPSFVVYDADEAKADSIRDVRTGLAIVSDLIYRGERQDIASADSLISTSGSVIYSPADLFGNATAVKASNGWVFGTSQLNYDNAETWNKPISVEAEKQNGRTYNNTSTIVYTRNASAQSTITDISGDSYIIVQPISASTNPGVTFEIPNVLAGEYDIYGIFLPAGVEDAEATPDSTKIQATLTYLRANGRTATANTSGVKMTDSQGVTKLLLFEGQEFPVSDYTDRLWLSDDDNDETTVSTVTTLYICTNVSRTEYTSGKFSRTFRLDRIVFEPIKK